VAGTSENLELQSMRHTREDAAAEPLIASGRSTPEEPHAGQDEVADTNEGGVESLGLFIWILTFCAGVSGLLFGYEYVSIPPRPITQAPQQTAYV
jgi:hypothetical protein